MRMLSLVLLIVQTGCVFHASRHHGRSDRGIALSEAMEASAAGGGQPMHSRSSSSDASSHVTLDLALGGGSDGGGGDAVLVVYDDREFTWQILLDVSWARPFNGSIDSLTRFTLTPFATEGEHHHFGIFIGGAIVHLDPGSLADRAVQDSWWLETGLAYRYHFNDSHRFLSPYLTLNASVQGLFWSYRSSITVDGEEVSADSLGGGGGYAGFGVVFERNNRLNFFGEIGVGGTLFSDTTLGGFENDVFDSFGYYSVKAGLSVKF